MPANTGVPTLTGDRITLRAPTTADKAVRLALGRNDEIERGFGGDPTTLQPLTSEDVDAWFEAAARQTEWVIEAASRFIGTIRLHSYVPADERAQLAVGILDPAFLDQAFGTEAIRVLLKHSFETLGLHRIGLRVLATNHRAIRSYQKCGFVLEGTERESALVAGAWQDDLIMGILRTGWLALQK